MKKEITRLQADIAAAEAKSATKCEEHQTLSAQYRELCVTHGSLELETMNVRKQLSKVNADLLSSQERITELANSIESLKSDLELKEKSNEMSQQSIQELEKNLEDSKAREKDLRRESGKLLNEVVNYAKTAKVGIVN